MKNKPILRRRLVIICIIIVIFSAHSYQHLGVETIRKSKLTKSRLPGARLITATILGDDGASLNRDVTLLSTHQFGQFLSHDLSHTPSFVRSKWIKLGILHPTKRPQLKFFLWKKKVTNPLMIAVRRWLKMLTWRHSIILSAFLSPFLVMIPFTVMCLAWISFGQRTGKIWMDPPLPLECDHK